MAKPDDTSSYIGVVGLGNWGTALGHHLGSKGHRVVGWSADAEIVRSINQTHRNSRYLSSAVLSPNLGASAERTAVIAQDVIILAVPSDALDKLSLTSSRLR